MNIEREMELVKTFVRAGKRDRHAYLLSSTKRRERFLRLLYHFDDFDPSCIEELAGETDSVHGLLGRLRELGAGKECYIISAQDEWDARTAPLDEAVRRVYCAMGGTVICCVPGKLAYYDGELRHDRYILFNSGT